MGAYLLEYSRDPVMLQYGEVNRATADKKAWLKKKLILILALLLVLAISVALFFLGRDPELIAELEGYGYLGAFLISLAFNAGVILAAPVLPILCTMGVAFYPVTGLVGPIMVGLAGGVGAGIGEMTGYGIGYSGRGIVERNKMYKRMEGWVRRWGVLAIFLLSLVPFLFDLAGLAAGALRVPFWKFAVACWLGRTVNYVILVSASALGWGALLRSLG
jgi:uncharacterized membrane protein YdjX (TVP38/TMEM64 family)